MKSWKAGLGLMAVGLAVMLSGCAATMQDWQAAQAENSAGSYTAFLTKHAHSEQAKQAQATLDSLVAPDWEAASVVNTYKSYQSFRDQYSYSTQAKSAVVLMDSIVEAEWKTATTTDTYASYDGYLRHPFIYTSHQAEAERLRLSKAGEKILPGERLERVVGILGMDYVVSRETMGGIYVGMGVFPPEVVVDNQLQYSTYTGTATLNGYEVVFDKGKVVSCKVVPELLGKKTAAFKYEINGMQMEQSIGHGR